MSFVKPGLFHIFSKNAHRCCGGSSKAARSCARWRKPLGEVVERLADALEVGPQLRLLVGRDRAVVERRAPVGAALVDGQRSDLVRDGGDDLDAARSGADDRHPLAGEVDRCLRATDRCGTTRRGSPPRPGTSGK